MEAPADMKILAIEIRQKEINYGLYKKLTSPLYPVTGNPFGFPLLFKEIKKGATTPENLSSLIEELKKEHRINYMVLGLPFYRFNHHIIELPLTEEKEIKTALPFELEKRLPLPLEEYKYDFLILKKKKEGSSVLTLSIRNQHLLNIIEPFSDTGIPIAGIKSTFMTVLSEFTVKNRGRAIIAERDGEYTYLACLLDSEIKHIRLISKDEEIEYPFGYEDPAIPGYLIKAPDGHSDDTVNKAFKNYSRIDINRTALIAKSLSEKRGFNFLHEELLPLKDKRLKVAGLFFGASVILFLLTDVIAYYKDYRSFNRLTQLMETIKEDKGSNPEEERSRLISRYSDFKKGAFTVLAELSRKMPSDTVLTAINFDVQNGSIEIEGNSSRSSSVLSALEQSGLFKNITYSGAITVKEGREIFKFKMEIR